jgi:hypothetical protein
MIRQGGTAMTIVQDIAAQAQAYYEKSSTIVAEAWELQQKFYTEFGERQVECYKAISDERLSSYQAMRQAQTPAQAFEANAAFEEHARERLQQLHETNLAAYQELQQSLNALYLQSMKAPAPAPAAAAG